jgi:aspartyl-tRNA(Asn)/glutamyl-tRNA(Gln) amidotransferase subunit A
MTITSPVAGLADATAVDLLAGFRSGDLSPVDAVEACLARIDALEPALNAVITLLAEPALEAARASADRWARGTALPLDGVPYGLKDIVATAGILTTGGSGLYPTNVPTESASHAARLQAAGGILLAKLGTFEFACGGAVNQAYGPVRNPWDPARTTGGSSSGSGAAVAAGMVPLAIGTDTGGSIRIPAAYCGITGLKATYGRVPRHGVMGLSWTLDHAGPMTRSVEDAALMLGVIAGYDGRDAHSSKLPVPDYVGLLDRPVAGMRVGRPRGWFEEPIHPAFLEAFERSLVELADLGIEVVDIEVPDVDVATAAAWQVCYAEMLSLHEGHFPTLEERDSMGAGMLAAAPFVPAGDYLRGLRYRSVFQAQFAAAMEGCDAMVLPGSTTPPPLLDDMLADVGDDKLDWLGLATRNHIPFNYLGVPGLCVPSGPAAGLPSSLQLIGHPHDDATLLALGAAYQAATDHHLARPAIVEEVLR